MTVREGIIYKALSGFYYVYVEADSETVECRACGRFRHDKITPVVGDRVRFSQDTTGKGMLEEILPRKNFFIRPAVANIDQMVIVVSGSIPVTDPILIDRLIAICGANHCEPVVCINKCDLQDGQYLYDIYHPAGYVTLRTSAVTGMGMDDLRAVLRGHVCAFTGNSGVGKSSILNALEPDFHIQTGEVSQKLGRGRHTTRHVELFPLGCDAIAADTPGFSAFDVERMDVILKENVQDAFREFAPYIGQCQFLDCAHIKEKGCAVRAAVEAGKIHPSRYASYVKLYEQASQIKDWERK